MNKGLSVTTLPGTLIDAEETAQRKSTDCCKLLWIATSGVGFHSYLLSNSRVELIDIGQT